MAAAMAASLIQPGALHCSYVDVLCHPDHRSHRCILCTFCNIAHTLRSTGYKFGEFEGHMQLFLACVRFHVILQ